ncbi:rRNA methyltransferase 1, mitochondrial [Ixodes scapularis]
MTFVVLHPIQKRPQCLLNAAYRARWSALCVRCFHNTARHHEGVAGVDLMALESGGTKTRTSQSQRHQAVYKKSARPPRVTGEVVFGLHPVLLVLKTGRRELFSLHVRGSKLKDTGRPGASSLWTEILGLAEQRGLAPRRSSLANLDHLTENRTHLGICLDASQLPVPDGHRLLAASESSGVLNDRLWVLMDRIQDPMNFGAVLRSSYYFGVQKVFTTRTDSCRLSPVVSKASSGALEVMDLYSLQSPAEFLQALKSKGWWVVGTAGVKQDGPFEAGPRSDLSWVLPPTDKPAILIVGNENQGMHPELGAVCDSVLSISPAASSDLIGSLNVSVATGIVLHELARGRTK